MDKAHSVPLLSRMSSPKKENLLTPTMPHDEKLGDVSQSTKHFRSKTAS